MNYPLKFITVTSFKQIIVVFKSLRLAIMDTAKFIKKLTRIRNLKFKRHRET